MIWEEILKPRLLNLPPTIPNRRGGKCNGMQPHTPPSLLIWMAGKSSYLSTLSIRIALTYTFGKHFVWVQSSSCFSTPFHSLCVAELLDSLFVDEIYCCMCSFPFAMFLVKLETLKYFKRYLSHCYFIARNNVIGQASKWSTR